MSWHPDDQNKALAWQSELDDRCPNCGTQSWQEGMFEAVRITCMSCADIARKRGEEFNQKVSNPGALVVLKRRG